MNFVNVPVKTKGDNLRNYFYDKIEPVCKLYMYCCWRSSYQDMQDRRVGIPLISLPPPHLRVCLKPGIGFLTSYVVFSEL